MESLVPPSEGLVGAQTLGEPSGENGRTATGDGSGEEEPRVSRSLPEGALRGGAEPWESSGAVDVDGALELESRSCASTEVVEEVELGLPSNGLWTAGADGNQEEKIGDGGASSGGGEGDEGDGGEQDVVVSAAENLFLAGDFVWGKIKSHPWWPGRVYDSADASEYARKVRRRDQQCVLVAYFGDRTFAWCDPSQLRPFTESFDRMAGQSVTKSFAGALNEALDEIQRCLESEMVCCCVPASKLAGLSGRPAANAGIKEGATVPRDRVKELSIVNHVPAQLLERLHETACDVFVTGLMEIASIKGWFSAFNRWMGWHVGFPAEHQDEVVQGLVDVKVSSAVPVKSSTKSSHKKKVRSMAELIAETDMETDVVEDSVDREKELLMTEKQSPRQRNKKNEERKLNADAGYEEGAGSGRRERKRSKYLSPPYTTLVGGRGVGHHPSSPRDEEAVYLKKDVEASDAEDSPSAGGDGASADEMLSEFQAAALDPMYLKGNRSSSKVRIFFDRFRSYSYANVSDYGKSPTSKIDTHVEELIKPGTDAKNIRGLEGKPGPAVESKTPDRCSIVSERKTGDDLKKKSLGSDTNETRAAKSTGKRKSAGQEGSGPEQIKPDSKKKKKKKEGEVINGDAGAALFITFAAGAPLPSKEELISAFGKYGPLCEPETELLRDSGCARVVFARSSDAEKVFQSSDRDGALGPGVAGCRLQYLHDNNAGITPLPPPGQKPPLQFVQKSLESMISALRESSSPLREVPGPAEELKPEARENLVDEMHGLLKKVNKLLSGSAAGAT